jgi:hypothetical protein
MMRLSIHYCKYFGVGDGRRKELGLCHVWDINHLIFSLTTPFKLESDRLEEGTSINVLYGEYGSLRIMRSSHNIHQFKLYTNTSTKLA